MPNSNNPHKNISFSTFKGSLTNEIENEARKLKIDVLDKFKTQAVTEYIELLAEFNELIAQYTKITTSRFSAEDLHVEVFELLQILDEFGAYELYKAFDQIKDQIEEYLWYQKDKTGLIPETPFPIYDELKSKVYDEFTKLCGLVSKISSEFHRVMNLDGSPRDVIHELEQYLELLEILSQYPLYDTIDEIKGEFEEFLYWSDFCNSCNSKPCNCSEVFRPVDPVTLHRDLREKQIQQEAIENSSTIDYDFEVMEAELSRQQTLREQFHDFDNMDNMGVF